MEILLHSRGNNLALFGKVQDIGSMLFGNSSPVYKDFIHLLGGMYNKVQSINFSG